jgi:hypothetical protein
MTKKRSSMEKHEADRLAIEREKYIRDFNINNAGKMRIEPGKMPTPEDIETAKKNFEERVTALKSKNDYLIADKENALRVAKFLKTYVETNLWVGTPTQPFFVGVLNFIDYIGKFIEECEKEPKDLVMEYGPMQFCFVAFQNYSGQGVEGAKHMAEIWDEFIAIYDVLRDNVEYYNSEVESCNALNDVWALMSQGFYAVVLDNVEAGTSLEGADDSENAPEAVSETDQKPEE